MYDVPKGTKTNKIHVVAVDIRVYNKKYFTNLQILLITLIKPNVEAQVALGRHMA